MANTIKTCDLSGHIAAQLFVMLNDGKVEFCPSRDSYPYRALVSDIKPTELTYPEGWYYAKGAFRNKHQSTTGLYEEVSMVKSNGEPWVKYCSECTLG